MSQKNDSLEETIRDAVQSGEKDITERISAAAEKLAALDEGPTLLIEALLAADRADLTPLAAERHFHATSEARAERSCRSAAEGSPIIKAAKDELLACPVGELGSEGLNRFFERILSQVLRTAPKKVSLLLGGLSDHKGYESAIEELRADLVGQGIELEIR